MMSGGHNDVSSTTATDSSSAAIQKIKNHLMSDLSSTPETSQTNISQYSTFEDTISTPASNTTDSFSDIQSLTIGYANLSISGLVVGTKTFNIE